VSTSLCLRGADGTVLPLQRDRWMGPVTCAEERLLDRVHPPALDVGCGPGRLVIALAERGIVALGVDAAPSAARIARERGAPVLRRSIFDPIPGEGRWGTALLLDGNVGIGGAPEALLLRLRHLLMPRGRVLLEVEPPGAPSGPTWVRIDNGGETTPPFPWGRVGADRLDRLAERTGFVATELWSEEHRWFGVLDRS
jgi:SAM-dependent methyltransferase